MLNGPCSFATPTTQFSPAGSDWPYPINSVFNAGAVRLSDGDTLLLCCRVEDRRGLSHLCAARSANGIDGWRIDSQPTMMAKPIEYPGRALGVSKIHESPSSPELQQYAIAYTSFARGGPGVSLALTRDFKTFERFGVIMPPEDKDAALLPHKIDGRWAMIHRPVTTLGAHMWISYLLARSASLGELLQGNAGSSPRWVVGREQNWALLATHRDREGLAGDLPRCEKHSVRKHLPPGPGAI